MMQLDCLAIVKLECIDIARKNRFSQQPIRSSVLWEKFGFKKEHPNWLGKKHQICYIN